MRPVILLARLNEIDLVVDALQARLAEIDEALKEPTTLRAARQALAAAEAELAQCQITQKDRELVQRQTAAKLVRAEKRLYSGRVRNPKELENAERDVQQLRRQRDRAEDVLLEALIATETATTACAEKRAELARLEAEWQATQESLRKERARLKERLSAQQTRQDAARRAAPAELLPLYDELRARRGGRAVAELDGNVCSACGVAVPPSKVERARYGDELVYCGNCGRLIWGE